MLQNEQLSDFVYYMIRSKGVIRKEYQNSEFKQKVFSDGNEPNECFDISFWAFIWKLELIPQNEIPPGFYPPKGSINDIHEIDIDWDTIDESDVADFMFKVKLAFFLNIHLLKQREFNNYESFRLYEFLIGVYGVLPIDLAKVMRYVNDVLPMTDYPEAERGMHYFLFIPHFEEFQKIYPNFLDTILDIMSYDPLLAFFYLKDYICKDARELQFILDSTWLLLLQNVNIVHASDLSKIESYFNKFLRINLNLNGDDPPRLQKFTFGKHGYVVLMFQDHEFNPTFKELFYSLVKREPVLNFIILSNMINVPLDFSRELWDVVMSFEDDNLAVCCFKKYEKDLLVLPTMAHNIKQLLHEVSSYICSNYHQRNIVWFPFVMYIDKKTLEPHLDSIAQGLPNNIIRAPNSWKHLCYTFPNLCNENKHIIPHLISERAFDALKYTVHNISSEYPVEYLPDLVPFCIDNYQTETLALTMLKVDIEHFRSYSDDLLSMVQKLEKPHSLNFFLRHPGENPAVETMVVPTPALIICFCLTQLDDPLLFHDCYGNWVSSLYEPCIVRLKPTRAEDHKGFIDWGVIALNLSIKLLDYDFISLLISKLVDGGMLRFDVAEFLSDIDEENYQKLYPHLHKMMDYALKEHQILSIWKLIGLFPNEIDVTYEIWDVTLMWAKSENVSPGWDIFKYIHMGLLWLRSFLDPEIPSMLITIAFILIPILEYDINHQNLYKILHELAKFDFPIPDIDKILQTCIVSYPFEESYCFDCIRFISDLTTTDSNIIKPYTERIVPFLALCTGLSQELSAASMELLEQFLDCGLIEDLELQRK